MCVGKRGFEKVGFITRRGGTSFLFSLTALLLMLFNGKILAWHGKVMLGLNPEELRAHYKALAAL